MKTYLENKDPKKTRKELKPVRHRLCILGFIFLSCLFCLPHTKLLAQTIPELIIQNPEKGGAKVSQSPDKNSLIFTSIDGVKLSLDQPFQTQDIDWVPSGPILCSWDPQGKYLAIFIPHPRATTIALVNLRTNSLLNEQFPEDIAYPNWYEDVYSTQDKPTKWENGKLYVLTTVKLKDGEERTMPSILSTSGNTFTLLPQDSSISNAAVFDRLPNNTQTISAPKLEQENPKNSTPTSMEWD